MLLSMCLCSLMSMLKSLLLLDQLWEIELQDENLRDSLSEPVQSLLIDACDRGILLIVLHIHIHTLISLKTSASYFSRLVLVSWLNVMRVLRLLSVLRSEFISLSFDPISMIPF